MTTAEARSDPRALLMAAHQVMESNEAVFDGCRAVTAAALTRQAIEVTLDARLRQLDVGWISKTAGLLCLTATADDPAAVREVHHTWTQLSDACHGTSYDLPPSHDDVQRWIRITARFIGA